jgi:hypothetical protein
MKKALWQSSSKDKDFIKSLWGGISDGKAKKLRKMI